MIAEAIRKSGPDRAKIRDAIEGLKDHVGVTAVYSYAPDDHFGAKADSVVLLTVTAFLPFGEVIEPVGTASRHVIASAFETDGQPSDFYGSINFRSRAACRYV
jgi:hypothetical protein